MSTKIGKDKKVLVLDLDGTLTIRRRRLRTEHWMLL